MNRNYISIAALGLTGVIAVLYTLLRDYTFRVLEPAGLVASDATFVK